jgi:PAS domain S-box-containing protein
MNHENATTAKLMHDLQVHQIELQLQNEELRRAQTALEVSRARYFDLYDMAPVGYLTVDANGLILETNLSAANLLGVARSKLVKQPLSRFIVKAHQDSYYHCRRQLLETSQTQHCELQLMHSDGVALWVKLDMSAATGDTDAPVLRVMLSDITERKRLNLVLEESNRELKNARLQADKANLAKSEFLSSMSHELRSPLNAVLGFAQLLEASALTNSQQASLAQILKGGWYLLALVNDILDLAAIEAGHAALTMEDVSLAEVLADCQTLIEPLTLAHAVQLRFSEIDGACRAHADEIRLKQVIINLLSNAIKYNREGGRVEVACRVMAGQRVRISVQDTGEGLTADKLSQLFQPFNRLGQEAGNTKGTGIGLVVSQRLVESMGGVMGVDSTVGEGSEFWVELNLAGAQPNLPAV